MGPLLRGADRLWYGARLVTIRTQGSVREWVRGPEDRPVTDRALRLATLTGAGWVLWVGVTSAPPVMWGLAAWGLWSSWRVTRPPRVHPAKGKTEGKPAAAPAGAAAGLPSVLPL
uniref:hypothetical protein n=1 Tax=Streptomyces otsuchiensis TaxID=2681388 RepID=UPI001D131E69